MATRVISQTIDLTNKPINKYITEITGGGIIIHPIIENENSSVQLDGSGIYFKKASNILASFTGSALTFYRPTTTDAAATLDNDGLNIVKGSINLNNNFIATTEGVITAKSGTVGGYDITSNSIQAYVDDNGNKTTSENGLFRHYMSWGANNLAFGVGSRSNTSDNWDWKFYVSHDGKLTATGADISGVINASSGSFSGTVTTSNITATGGVIGGWSIDGTRIYKYADASGNTTTAANALYYVYIQSAAGTDGGNYAIALRTRTAAQQQANNPAIGSAPVGFGVSWAGSVLARSLTVNDSNNVRRATVGTSGLICYDTDGSTQVASFGASARIGKTSDTNIYIAAAGTDAGFKLNVKNSAGTSSVALANIGFDNSQGYETSKNFPKGLWYTFGDRAGTAAQRGYYSFVNGFNNRATHNASVAFGIDNNVYAPCAMSIGLSNSIGDSSKTSINSYSTSGLSGTGSLTVGYGLQATGLYQIVAGCYNTATTDAYLVIGNGNSASARSNSLVVSKTGTITMNNGQFLRLNSGAGSAYSWNQIWAGNADGGDGGVTSNLYLQADGYIGFYVGTTSTAPTGRMYVHYDGVDISGDVRCKGKGTFEGTSTTTSAANARIGTVSPIGRLMYNASSSRRYKHDIKDLSDEILNPEHLYDIKLRQFKYNSSYLDEGDERSETNVPGFIAEEIYEIYPIAVDLDDEGLPQDWNDRYIIPPMLALIQEQHKEIEQLKKEVAQLKNK